MPNRGLSTRGWSLQSLVDRSSNFERVKRVSAETENLPAILQKYERKGVPLVIEGFHKDARWPTGLFTLDSFAENSKSKDISVRNVHDWTDKTIPLADFILKSRAASSFQEPDERERLYGKDAESPEKWTEWLQNEKVVPPEVLPDGPDDLFRFRPKDSPIETLMCYIGVGDTFTPCHKDLCASSGQNLMCHTEGGGTSFWFMTAGADAPAASKYFQRLKQELDHENYVITVEELAAAPFKVYVVEQKLGDLVLVPPRSCHQVVNYGGITVKMSWSRMTRSGLETAYYHELSIYRRVCRPEVYRVKSTILHALLGQTKAFKEPLSRNASSSNSTEADNVNDPLDSLASELKQLVSLYGSVLQEESPPPNVNTLQRRHVDPAHFDDDIVCDFCGADIFYSFFECRKCRDATSDGCVVCSGCYAEGRSCKCFVMAPTECRDFNVLLEAFYAATVALGDYEGMRGRSYSFELELEKVDADFPSLFHAAYVICETRKKALEKGCPTKQCSVLRHSGIPSHAEDSSCVVSCKGCHQGCCFTHALKLYNMHSARAILLFDKPGNVYHKAHQASKLYNLETNLRECQERGTKGVGHHLLALMAGRYKRCSPANRKFMELGWYDPPTQLCPDVQDSGDAQACAEEVVTPPPSSQSPQPASPIPSIILTSSDKASVERAQLKRKSQVPVGIPPAPYQTRRSLPQTPLISGPQPAPKKIRQDSPVSREPSPYRQQSSRSKSALDKKAARRARRDHSTHGGADYRGSNTERANSYLSPPHKKLPQGLRFTKTINVVGVEDGSCTASASIVAQPMDQASSSSGHSVSNGAPHSQMCPPIPPFQHYPFPNTVQTTLQNNGHDFSNPPYMPSTALDRLPNSESLRADPHMMPTYGYPNSSQAVCYTPTTIPVAPPYCPPPGPQPHQTIYDNPYAPYRTPDRHPPRANPVFVRNPSCATGNPCVLGQQPRQQPLLQPYYK